MAKAKSKKITIEDALVPVEEQPYEVPENWCWVYGRSILKDMETKKPDGEFFGYIDIDSIDNKNQRVTEAKKMLTSKAPSRASRKLHSGDTVFSMVRPYLKNIAYITEDLSDCIASTGFYVCSPQDIVDSKYLYYLMISPYVVDGLNDFMKGDNSPSIRKDDIEKFEFPIPPLPEQQRIVEQIESLFLKLDEAKEMAQYALDSIGVRKESILLKALDGYLTETWRMKTGIKKDSWKVKKIEDLSDVKGGKRVPKGMSLVSEDTGHPYIKAGNLKKGTVIDECIQYVPADVLEYIKNYTVKAGDVYITNVGACIGDCGVIPEKYNGANLTENAVKMTNLRECESEFLAYYLASNHVQQIIKGLIASATLGKLSIANIKGIEINLPMIEEQGEIIRIIKEMFDAEDNVANTIEKVLDDIELMRKSILAKAFRGELGTNVLSEESSIELLKQIIANE